MAADLLSGVRMSDAVRECGPCTACCTVFAVSELEKGMHETCTHVCETGCAIYPDRPEPCRAFRCQWLRGLLEVDGTVDLTMRPDACGVVFDYQPQTPYGDAYTAWEVEAGAAEGETVRRIIEGLQEHFLVMIATRSAEGSDGIGERRFVGPPDQVARAREAARDWTP